MKTTIISFLKFLLVKLKPPNTKPISWEVPKGMEVGSRILINDDSGFSRGHKGTIQFVEPLGKVWVRRDRSCCNMFFYPYELDLINDKDR
jgi:hypothetical protein